VCRFPIEEKAMRSALRICVVGSANVDLTFRTPRLPRPGETLAGRSFQLGLGGKGANQAVAAARLGAAAALVACLGDDTFGRESLRRYQAEGLDTAFVRLHGELPTGTAAIVVDDQAQNCILVVAGANAGLSPADVRAAAPAIQQADLLLCQLEVPLETTLEAFRLARAAGVRTVLTPAPAAALPEELLLLCDLCVPNETEAEFLTGQAIDGVGAAETAAGELRRRGVEAVVVTLGGRGALLLDDAGPTHVPAVPVQAVDPTGAGDAFTAALAVFWAEGPGLREAARQASAVAALTVTRPGTQTAFPTRAEVEA
jgi:ribokinase